MTARTLTPAGAYRIASDWGSYLHNSDPGACMYGFRAGDGRPVSEEHRAQCLAYLAGYCLPVARYESKSHSDVAELEALQAFLISAPLWSEARR